MYTLEKLLKPTPDNLTALRQRLVELRENRDLRDNVSSIHLATQLGVITKAQVDNFMRGRAISVAGYTAIVKYLWDQKWWIETSIGERLSEHPAALFHALCSFLNAGEETKNNLRREIAGTYRVWRASMHFPGEYLLGKMVIVVEPSTMAVRATEIQRFKGSKFASDHREIFEGFLVKKSRYFMIIARQSGRHKGAPRMTIIHNALYEDNIVQAMQGVVTGCYGSNMLFSTPVYIERVKSAEAAQTLDDDLDVCFDVPRSIKAKLRLRLDGNVIRF